MSTFEYETRVRDFGAELAEWEKEHAIALARGDSEKRLADIEAKILEIRAERGSPEERAILEAASGVEAQALADQAEEKLQKRIKRIAKERPGADDPTPADKLAAVAEVRKSVRPSS